jgi:hypothetical protein
LKFVVDDVKVVYYYQKLIVAVVVVVVVVVVFVVAEMNLMMHLTDLDYFLYEI